MDTHTYEFMSDNNTMKVALSLTSPFYSDKTKEQSGSATYPV